MLFISFYAIYSRAWAAGVWGVSAATTVWVVDSSAVSPVTDQDVCLSPTHMDTVTSTPAGDATAPAENGSV